MLALLQTINVKVQPLRHKGTKKYVFQTFSKKKEETIAREAEIEKILLRS